MLHCSQFINVLQERTEVNKMSVSAIVYKSSTGHTAAYAQMLGEELKLPVYDLKQAGRNLKKRESVIFLGWLMAGSIQGYQKASKKYNTEAVCVVGLGDNSSQTEILRKANGVPEEVALFTLQGGMNKDQLPAKHRMMIRMLIRVLLAKTDKSDEENGMLYLLEKGGNFVNPENLKPVIEWQQGK